MGLATGIGTCAVTGQATEVPPAGFKHERPTLLRRQALRQVGSMKAGRQPEPGPGVEAVLDELPAGVGRALDDFAAGDPPRGFGPRTDAGDALASEARRQDRVVALRRRASSIA